VDWRVIGGVLAGLALAWLMFVLVLWIVRPRGVPVRELVRIVPDLLRLARSLATDPDVPLGVRLALWGLVAWLLSPIDLIPEFVPIIGPLDDAVVAVLVLRYVRRRLGHEALQRRWTGTEAGYRLLARVLGGASD
jgi:uncharacterized membrane protein YkvA (DUF1232 family)